MVDTPTANFIRAFDATVGVERGYVVDQGGPTRYGVTEKVARAFGYTGDMKSFPLTTARQIYYEEYWSRVAGDKLPWPLALFVFDASVNQGVGAAIKMLQAAAGVAQDGDLGPQTLKAVLAADAHYLATLYMALRALRYTGTRGFDIDGKGWLRRLFTITLDASNVAVIATPTDTL